MTYEFPKSTSWHSYPSSFQIGHRYLAELFHDTVLVEEKIDGSQFSFGVYYPQINGIGGPRSLRIRSKNQEINVGAPEKLFERAVDAVRRIEPLLNPGWTYRAEFLSKPKHNTLSYGRVPNDYLILFDINPDHEEYLLYDAKAAEAERLGLEVVPRLFEGKVESYDQFREFLSRESILGNTTIEGIVVKNYLRYGRDKKILIGKYVSEAFKEKNECNWKKENPTQSDIIARIADVYRTDARWQKVVQHQRDAGKLDESPKDIGLLIHELKADVIDDSADEIKDMLFQWAWPHIERRVRSGFPEWYKDQLAKSQGFAEPTIVEIGTDDHL